MSACILYSQLFEIFLLDALLSTRSSPFSFRKWFLLFLSLLCYLFSRSNAETRNSRSVSGRIPSHGTSLRSASLRNSAANRLYMSLDTVSLPFSSHGKTASPVLVKICLVAAPSWQSIHQFACLPSVKKMMVLELMPCNSDAGPSRIENASLQSCDCLKVYRDRLCASPHNFDAYLRAF